MLQPARNRDGDGRPRIGNCDRSDHVAALKNLKQRRVRGNAADVDRVVAIFDRCLNRRCGRRDRAGKHRLGIGKVAIHATDGLPGGNGGTRCNRNPSEVRNSGNRHNRRTDRHTVDEQLCGSCGCVGQYTNRHGALNDWADDSGQRKRV